MSVELINPKQESLDRLKTKINKEFEKALENNERKITVRFPDMYIEPLLMDLEVMELDYEIPFTFDDELNELVIKW